MGDYMKEASFSLAEAKFAMGDFNHLVLQNVSKAQLKLKIKKDNVAGLCVCDTIDALLEKLLVSFEVLELCSTQATLYGSQFDIVPRFTCWSRHCIKCLLA